MKTIINRKIPIFTLITLLLIGGIFSIKVFTSASKPQPSLLRETQTLSELSANFTTSKLGIFQFPEIIITSDLNGNAITVPLATGDILKGWQPVLQLSDSLWRYTSALESSKMLLDSTQELYEKAIANFSKELQKAETTISDLQAKLHQTEKDLQDILLLTSENGTGETQALKQALLQTLETTENTLEQAKLDYELLKSTKSSQLSDLEHTLQSARKEYENAYTTYNKLTIRTPQAGTVKEIFISENDSIWEGNPLFSLIPEKANPTVEVQVNFEEYLTTLEITGVQLHGQVEKSEISSRSPIANASGMYTLTIPNPNQLPNTSTYIEVEFSLSTEFLYLPKEILEITDQHTGFLYIFSEKEVQKVPVELGHQRNEYIEIKTPLNNATQIITNRREYL